MAKLRISATDVLKNVTGSEELGCRVTAARYIAAADAIEIEIEGSDVPNAEYVIIATGEIRDQHGVFKTVFEGFKPI